LSRHIAHAPHDDVHVDVLQLLSDTVGLCDHKLVPEELMHRDFPLLAEGVLLVHTELFGEDDVVTNLLSNWLLNLIALELHEFILYNVVLLKFVPVLLSFVK
jgi:hypothetical protein